MGVSTQIAENMKFDDWVTKQRGRYSLSDWVAKVKAAFGMEVAGLTPDAVLREVLLRYIFEHQGEDAEDGPVNVGAEA